MNAVDKLIFNAMASHRGINMPGLGSLCVEKSGAKLRGSRRLVPPGNYVVWNTKQQDGFDSLPAIIASACGHPGEEIYAQWLADLGVANDNGHMQMPPHIAIEGVGSIVSGKFTPSSELDALLDPTGRKPLRLRPRCRLWLAVLTVACMLAVAGGACFMLCLTAGERAALGSKYFNCSSSTAAPEAPPANAIVTPVAPPDSTSHGSTSPQTPQQTPDVPQTTAAAQVPADSIPPKASVQPASSPNGTQYHIVLGVFTIRPNAERYIRELTVKDRATAAVCTVIPMGQKFIVSAYASPKRAEAESKRRQMSGSYPETWIYVAHGAN